MRYLINQRKTNKMGKLYTKPSKEEKHQLVPKKETISFLLNYSKALSVVGYHNMKFKTLLN